MSIFMNRKNIRINKSNLFRLISRGIADKRNIIRKGSSYIFFNSVPYAYARRIVAICDLEVLSDNDWVFVRNMDYDKLEEIYKKEDIVINKEGTIEIAKESIEEVYQDKIDQEPVSDVNKEIINDTDYNNEIIINNNDIQSDDISNDIDEKENQEYNENNDNENNVEENIIENNLDENEKEENIIAEEENEIDIKEEIQHNFNQLNLNNFGINRPSFKKKKKK